LHIADGVLSPSVVGAAAAAAGGLLWYSARELKAEEVPRVGLLAAAFFVSSLLRIPVGVTSIHPVLLGLTGVFLGRRAPLAVFLGLLLQALLFQHGGLTTLGVNLLIMGLPALLAGLAFPRLRRLPVTIRGVFGGGAALVMAVSLLIGFLVLSADLYAKGPFSLANLLAAAYLPVLLAEAALTGFAVRLVQQVRPEMIQ
jgi:cobalt/nickel transport system permease protein